MRDIIYTVKIALSLSAFFVPYQIEFNCTLPNKRESRCQKRNYLSKQASNTYFYRWNMELMFDMRSSLAIVNTIYSNVHKKTVLSS